MRYSGFQFPDGVAVLDRETGELIYHPIDGGEARVIRPADPSVLPSDPRLSRSGYDGRDVGIEEVPYRAVGDDRHPRSTGEVDVPSRQADTDPGLRRSIRVRDIDDDAERDLAPAVEGADAEEGALADVDPLSSHDELDRLVLGRFPYPIAAAYRSFINETDPRRACRRLVAAGRSVVQFLAIVSARDALESLEALDEPFLRVLRRDLQRPSFRTWHALLGQALRVVREAGRAPFCPELFAAYDTLERRCEEPFVLERSPEPPLRLGYLAALVAYRDSLSEGFSFTHERAHADLARYRPVLTRLLEGCRFLADYSLVTADADSPSAGRKLRGAVPEEPAFELSPELEAGAVALYHDASGRRLDLADLVMVADEVSPARPIDGMSGDVALIERRRGNLALFRSVNGRAVTRDLAAVRWAELTGRISNETPRALNLIDRGVLGAAAKRTTNAVIQELAESGRLLDDAVIPRAGLERALRRFEFSGFVGLVLVGEEGSGRTTTLARYARARQEAGDLVLLYRCATLGNADLIGRICADLGVVPAELPDLLPGLDPHFQIPATEGSLDTIGPRFLVMLDGLEESAVELPALCEAIAAMVGAAAEHSWFRVITSISPGALARVPDSVRPGQNGELRYFRTACRRGGGRSECPWVRVAPLSPARLPSFYEGYRLRRGAEGGAVETGGAVFRPSTAFSELDRSGTTVSALRHVGSLRLALRAFHDRPLPSDLTADAIERAWYLRVVQEDEDGDRVSDRGQTLASIVRELARRQAVYVARHELEDGERLGPVIRNAEVDSSYSQLVARGVLDEVWVDDVCLVGVGTPHMLTRLLAAEERAEVSEPPDYLGLARRSIAYPPLAGALGRLLIEAVGTRDEAFLGSLDQALVEEPAGAALRQSFVGGLSRLALDRWSDFEGALSSLSGIGTAAVTQLLSESAAELRSLGLTRAARAAFEAAARSARSADDGEQLALARADLAALRAEAGEVKGALEDSASACEDAESGGHRLGTGILALQQARLLAERGDTQGARASIALATSRLPGDKHPEASAEAKLLEGQLAAEGGDTELAVTCLREGLAWAKASGRVLLATEALHGFRATPRNAAQRAAVADLIESALSVLQVAGRFEWIPRMLTQLGMAVAGRHPRRSETYLRRGLALADRLGSREDAADLLARLGEVLRREGRVREAERALTQSLELSEGDPKAVERGRTLLMGVQIDRGELAGLETTLRRAIREAQHNDEPEIEGVTTLLLAQVYASKGRLAQAADYFTRGLDRFESAGDRESRGEALVGLAKVAARRGDHDLARERWDAVLGLGEELALGWLTAEALEGLALLGAPDAADTPAHLTTLTRLAERFEHRLWQQRTASVRGELAHHRGALDEAASAWSEALERAEHLGLAPAAARARLGLGRVHLDAGRLGPAHQEAQTAGTFFESSEHDLDLADALAVQGLCSFAAERLESAEECFDRQRSLAAALGYDPGLAHGLRLGAEVAFELGAIEDATTRWQRFAEMTDGQESYRLDRDVLALRAALADGRKEEIARAEDTLRQTTEAEGHYRPVGENAALVFRACAGFWTELGENTRAEAAREAGRFGN